MEGGSVGYPRVLIKIANKFCSKSFVKQKDAVMNLV